VNSFLQRRGISELDEGVAFHSLGISTTGAFFHHYAYYLTEWGEHFLQHIRGLFLCRHDVRCMLLLTMVMRAIIMLRLLLLLHLLLKM
jgi:hypothetical protein